MLRVEGCLWEVPFKKAVKRDQVAKRWIATMFSKKTGETKNERWADSRLMHWDGSRSAGKADTISPVGFFLTAEVCKSVTATKTPQVDLPLTMAFHSVFKKLLSNQLFLCPTDILSQ